MRGSEPSFLEVGILNRRESISTMISLKLLERTLNPKVSAPPSLPLALRKTSPTSLMFGPRLQPYERIASSQEVYTHSSGMRRLENSLVSAVALAAIIRLRSNWVIGLLHDMSVTGWKFALGRAWISALNR
jgi:hypothetical protein